MKSFLPLLLAFLLSACSISTIPNQDNITTYDPTVDISHIEYDGGDGKTEEDAIVILKARTLQERIASEYAYMEKLLGQQNIDWKVIQQYSTTKQAARFDVLKVQDLKTDSTHFFYFDISKFLGKM